MVKHTHKQSIHQYILQFEHIYKRIKHFLVWLFLAMTLLGVIVLIALTIYFYHLTQSTDKLSDQQLVQRVTHISGDELIDHSNKNILQEYDRSQNSLIVGPHTLNHNVIKALTSSEDTLFFKHRGILPKALIRAMIQDVFNTTHTSGGSTITQQLIKNQVLSNAKTYDRKANELKLAFRLETLMSKDEIIYTYLNIVAFGRDYNGSNITGIGSASYSLFNTPPKDLNIAQSAYLVGLLQSPYLYTPYLENGDLKRPQQLQYSIQRQHYVLKRMLVEHRITKKQYEKALKYNVPQHLMTKPIK